MKAIIIDDEKLARDVIKAFLKSHEDIEVVAQCENGFVGFQQIQEHKPDLVFLDVQMPKINGFEMLELIEQPPAVVFTTAFDEFAIKAFERNAVDYLLKPFSKSRFDESVEKVRKRLQSGSKEEIKQLLPPSTLDHDKKLERIAIKNGSNIIILPVEKITLVEAQDDYVAFFSEGKKYLKQHTMKYLEEVLPSNNFIRVHRSYIINVGFLLKLEPVTKDSFIAKLNNGMDVPVSRAGYGLLKEHLEI